MHESAAATALRIMVRVFIVFPPSVLIALISTASSTSTSSSETACPALDVTRATQLPCGSRSQCRAMLRLGQQLIALDPRARVIGRPQPDQLRA
jgi:hypothetical protein